VGQEFLLDPLLVPQLLLDHKGDAHHPLVLLVEILLAVDVGWEDWVVFVVGDAQELPDEAGLLRGGFMGLGRPLASVRHLINIIIRSCTYGGQFTQLSRLPASLSSAPRFSNSPALMLSFQ
jgi:hypothetical protein